MLLKIQITDNRTCVRNYTGVTVQHTHSTNATVYSRVKDRADMDINCSIIIIVTLYTDDFLHDISHCVIVVEKLTPSTFKHHS